MKSLINIALYVPQALLGGFVFAHLWNWFIVRKFPGTSTLTFMDAIGILSVVSFPLIGIHMANAAREIRKDNPNFDSKDIAITVSLFTLFFVYPIILGVGYLWHMAIG